MVKHLQKIILAAIMLLAANGVWAADFGVMVNGRTVRFNIIGNNTVEVTSGGAYSSGDILLTPTVSYNSRTYTVTRIGDGAFAGSGVTSITIPYSVTSIGADAFINCTNLTAINVNNRNTHYVANNGVLFSYAGDTLICCPGGKSGNYTIPNTVTNIGRRAFGGCTALTSITIPNSVTDIGEHAFRDCSSLISINIPNMVSRIRAYTFWNCNSLSSVTISNTVTNIGLYAFSFCPSLTSITIPNSVTEILRGAFQGCSALTSVNIPDSVISLGDAVFMGCSRLSSVTIGKSIDTIPQYAFRYDSALTSITFRRPNTKIDSFAFQGVSSSIPVHVPCGATSWYRNQLGTFSNFVEFMAYSYSAVSQDTTMGHVTTDTVPTCSNNVAWTVTATANSGYNFSHWSDGDSNAHRTINLTWDTTITAYFRWSNFAVMSEDTNKGHVQIVIQPTQVRPQATIIALPNVGYTFSHWSDGNIQNPRSLTITQDTLLTAYFSPNTYNVIVLSNDTTKGSVSGSGRFAYMTQDTIVATSNYGYFFSHWSDGDTTNPRIITITQDTNFTAFYNFNYYNVAVSSNDTTKGSVSGSGRFAYLSQDTLFATPSSGYTFSRWSDGDTTNPRVITVTQDTSFTAFYDFNYYNVAVSSDDTIKGSVSGSGRFAYMTQDTIVATSNYGYSFSHWSDGDTMNPRIITVRQDTTLMAYFLPNTYNVIVSSNDTTKGSVSGSGRFVYLSQDTLFATPNSGYTFSHWSDGDTMNPRVITITQDTAIIAYFTQTTPQPWYNFVVASEDTNKGTVQIVTQPTQASPQALIVALPKTGYSFARWSDGNTQNPRTLTVTQDTVLIAFFASNQGIAEAENDNISIRTANGHILLEGVSNEHVCISDVLGRVVYNASVNKKVEIAVRNRGMFFVKVGNRPAKKVVVVR